MRRVIIVALVLSVLAGSWAVWQSWRSTPTAAAPGQTGWVSTPWGPLGPGDRDLLVQVRLAGLWEMPTGQEMAERGSQKRVREIGAMITNEHEELDRITRDAAAKLGVALPNQATTEKQAWMWQISSATGASYDWTAVNLLRQAHGAVLPVIIGVRAGTRNDVVRAFADQAAGYVTRHMGYLESTGLVDFARLDEPPTPPRAVVTRSGQYENVPVALLAIGGLILIVGLGVLVASLGLNRRRPKPPDRHRAGPAPPGGTP